MAVRRAIKKYWVLYLMALPGLLWYLVFKYIPMPTGLIIAMEKYVPWKGLWGSEWVWFDNFKRLFESEVLWDLLKNTLLLSALSMIFAFPSSIILALLINELRCRWFKRSVQTVAYLPYFLSWAIVAGLAFNILDTNYGLLNQLLEWLGKDPVTLCLGHSSFGSRREQ
jgi:ABC-type polysaccharide transport system, permease component